MTDHDDLDLLDGRLQDYGARWRAALPEPATPQPVTGAAAGDPRRWLVPAAAAAVVAVIFGLAFAVTAGDEKNPAPADVTPTPTPDDVVPWAPLPATHPELPTVTESGSPGPGTAGVPGCAPGDLTAEPVRRSAAAGTMALTVELSLDRGRECVVEGFPQAVLLDHGAVTDVAVDRDQSQGTPERVLVSDDEPAVVTLFWSPGHYCGGIDNDQIRLALPGGAEFLVGGFGATTCNPGEDQPNARVQPVRSLHERGTAPRVHSPYRNVRIGGDLDLTVEPGAIVNFEIVLTSAEDLPLDICPDYEIWVGPRGETYALNCAAVPHRDDLGRPYLPAGVPVRFAMRTEASDVTVDKFNWNLVAPSRPGVGGVLTVDAAPDDGTITGIVTMDGGPAPGTSVEVTSGTVTVTGEVGGTYTAEIGPDGTFEIDLPAGAYDLEVSTPQWNDGSPFRDGMIGVTGGSTVRGDVSLPMK